MMELYTYPENNPHNVDADSVLFDDGVNAVVTWDRKTFNGPVKNKNKYQRSMLVQDEGGSNDGNWLCISWFKQGDNFSDMEPVNVDMRPLSVRRSFTRLIKS